MKNTYTRTEGSFTGFQGIRLFYQRWTSNKPTGTLVITHGQGEHSECYLRTVEALQTLGLNLWAWDLRGHGRSEGLRGYTGHFQDYCNDLEILFGYLMGATQSEGLKNLPVFALGHSMGGLIQLKALIDNPQWPLSAQVLSAPLLGYTIEVPKYKDLAARALIHLLPKVTMSNEIQNEQLSRDPRVHEEYQRDTLRTDRISAAVYLGSLEAITYVQARAAKVKIPSLVQIPESDPVVSSASTRSFFAQLPRGLIQVKEYPLRRHEIYNDLDREVPLADLTGFLAGHLS